MAVNDSRPDFGGWATKNDLKCTDGRIICGGAFAVQDGARVPLVWNHTYSTPESVLGHAELHNRSEGVWADCYFNNSQPAQAAKQAVIHGDIDGLSIYANELKQDGPYVRHGTIKEVSLVIARANPGAVIESIMVHGQPLFEDEDEGQLYPGLPLSIYHADAGTSGTQEDKKPESESKAEKTDKEKTVQDVLDSLNPEQKRVVTAVIGLALESAANGASDDENDEEDTKMSHNAFEENGGSQAMSMKDTYLSHSDVQTIMKGMKAFGSLRESWNRFIQDREAPVLMHSGIPAVYDEDDVLIHAGIPNVPTTGMTTPSGSETYGFRSPDMFYPDARAMTNPPEFISRDQAWVSTILNGVHTTPFSRVKSWFADITEDEARARGYIKGKQKKAEVFKTLKRTTTPTTVYKLQKLDRDDIIDITDFDVVAWIRGEMRMMLNEEVARAILIGDGRTPGTDDKINEDNIRPIATDVDLFNVKVDLDFSEIASDPAKQAKAFIDGVIRGHKNYRGSGSPILFTTEDWVTEMLLLEDAIGHKLYKSVDELATTLRVSKIVTVELLENQYVDGDTKKKHLAGVIVNPRDYNVGRDRGGEVSMFDDFDIDFNQQKYLIETRMSGALTRPFSAITISYSLGE